MKGEDYTMLIGFLIALTLVIGCYLYLIDTCDLVCCDCDKSTHLYYDLGDNGKSTYQNITDKKLELNSSKEVRK